MSIDTAPETVEELREAITNMAATAAKMPAHWVDRRAAIHARVNELLDKLEQMA